MIRAKSIRAVAAAGSAGGWKEGRLVSCAPLARWFGNEKHSWAKTGPKFPHSHRDTFSGNSISDNAQGNFRCVLHGFSRHASRVDLEMVLGDSKPAEVMPYLSRSDLMFSGFYRLRFETSEEIDQLKSILQKRSDHKYFISDDNSFKTHIPANFLNVSRRSVLVSGITGGMQYTGMYLWLAGFHLAPPENQPKIASTIHMIPDRDNESAVNAIVHCASIAEARRLVCNKSLPDDQLAFVRISHYHA
jgi:hypothetical protein